MFNSPLVRSWYGLAALLIDVSVTLVVANLVRHLRAHALREPLTGAYNRRGLEDGAALAHDLDSRAHHATTIVEMDLDGFTQHSHAHGHVAGDALPARIVLILWATDRVEAEARRHVDEAVYRASHTGTGPET